MRGTHKVTLIKKSAGEYVDGIWKPGKVRGMIPVDCNIQPIPGRELQFFPEGERHRMRYVMYTESPTEITDRDEVTYNGKTYKIFRRQDRRQDFLQHDKVYLGELDG